MAWKEINDVFNRQHHLKSLNSPTFSHKSTLIFNYFLHPTAHLHFPSYLSHLSFASTTIVFCKWIKLISVDLWHVHFSIIGFNKFIIDIACIMSAILWHLCINNWMILQPQMPKIKHTNFNLNFWFKSSWLACVRFIIMICTYK